MFTKNEVLRIAKEKFALDYACKVSDFETAENIIVENKSKSEPIKILCFSGKIIISASSEIMPWCEENLKNRVPAWFFEYPKLRRIDRKLNELGYEIEDVHHYYLPNPDIKYKETDISVKWYEAEEILKFENDSRFEEAFAFDKERPDILAVAALDGDNIMGMAGASEDSKTMWQIGIDVMPEYRGRGIGTKLVNLLKNEILKRGKVPFYGTVESHFHSQNIAINAGFFPVWAELHSSKKRI